MHKYIYIFVFSANAITGVAGAINNGTSKRKFSRITLKKKPKPNHIKFDYSDEDDSSLYICIYIFVFIYLYLYTFECVGINFYDGLYVMYQVQVLLY